VDDDFKVRLIELLPRLRRFALSLTGDQDRADDLVQEACVRALSNVTQWQAGTRLDSWMYKITQNLWFDRLRAAKVRGEVIDIEDYTHLVGSDGRDVTSSRQDLVAVSKRISELPQDQQLLIGLICIDGLSYKEAADALSVPIGTVMSRLARARASLHDAIDTVAVSKTPLASGKRHERNF
jgi:RNA polymerase sigma-70 factor, ECF subfamily